MYVYFVKLLYQIASINRNRIEITNTSLTYTLASVSSKRDFFLLTFVLDLCSKPFGFSFNGVSYLNRRTFPKRTHCSPRITSFQDDSHLCYGFLFLEQNLVLLEDTHKNSLVQHDSNREVQDGGRITCLT